ncbi:MAG: site-2 protease family protein [Isosphaerales bacterium]
MNDFLTWSPISLGRWFGTSVRVHISLIIFLVFWMVTSAVSLAAKGDLPQFPAAICWLGLLLVALAVHELAHAATAVWLDCDQEDVHLWPLGSLVGPSFMPRSSEHFLVAMAGPIASGAIFLGSALGVSLYAGAQFAWSPFGNEGDAGAPRLAGGLLAAPLSPVWVVGWFGYLNLVLMLSNLIPALPFDGGRMLRAYLSSTSVVSSRESIAAPWTAHACAWLLGLIGLVRLVSGRYDGIWPILLGLFIEGLVRIEARMLEDGGYFEDGVFGYDFSEGYTSLESGAAKVRPFRESALKRWRRRRSELRRQRRIVREAAEEQRMDEILQKLHREGRDALTGEEHRFLVRVSTRYRNRTKSRE